MHLQSVIIPRARGSRWHANAYMAQPANPTSSWLLAQRLVDSQEQLQELYKLAQAFQEGSKGRYMYGQDSLDPGTFLPPEAQETSNGHHFTLRCVVLHSPPNHSTHGRQHAGSQAAHSSLTRTAYPSSAA